MSTSTFKLGDLVTAEHPDGRSMTGPWIDGPTGIAIRTSSVERVILNTKYLESEGFVLRLHQWQWGYVHSQGINAAMSEQRAREGMADVVKRDERVQLRAQGKARLVRRTVPADWTVVENPYEQGDDK